MRRDRLIVILFALLAAASAIGFGIMFSSLGCGGSGSCPAQAVVNGISYGASGQTDLPGVDAHLVPAADATNTAIAPTLSEMTLYSVADIDQSLIMVGRALPNENRGEFVVLFSIERSQEAWAALCQYVTGKEAAGPSSCRSYPRNPPVVTSDEIEP